MNSENGAEGGGRVIEVDLSNRPPFIIHVIFGEGSTAVPVTWPFPNEEAARVAYALAVQSGKFTRTLSPATKRRPAVTVTLVSLWRHEKRIGADGQPHGVYVGIGPWTKEAAS